jgi:hypothetical protein
MFRSIVALSCVLCTAAGVVRAQGPYEGLLKYAPASANTIALIDVKGAFSSQLAKRENWAEKGQANNRGGLGFVPSGAEQVVIAVDLNLNAMTRNFQIGLVKLRNVPPMNELAAREGGTYDDIADRSTVLSPRDVYYIAMSASELAAVYPADRQNTARWIRAAKAAKAPPLTPYLKSAADSASSNTVTIAMDLSDAVDRTILRQSLPASPSVAKNKTVDLGRLAKFLSGIKGMTFKAKIEGSIAASMTWDFEFNPAEFKQTLPNLIMELIDGQGISIPDLEHWVPSFTETSMTLSGSLTTLDLKRIVSLFAFPTANEDQGDMPKEVQVSAAMTKRYFSTVTSIVEEMKKSLDNPNYEKTATWHEKAAAQIEHLSRQRVDPDAVNAALQLAARLKAIAESLRGVPINVDALENQAYVVSLGRQISIGVGGWWGFRPGLAIGGIQYDSNIPQIQAAIDKVVKDDQKHRTDVWNQIDRIISDMRKTLGDRYK